MKILLLNQCFYPDVVSTAQHLTDLATVLSDRGHSVTVLTSDRGYDDPSVRFPRREVWNGIDIRRIPSVAWGKGNRWKRAANFSSFLLMCAIRLLFLPRFDAVVALTSPPLLSVLAAVFVRLKGGRLCCWMMDLNPDEAIAAGWLRKDSMTARLLVRLMNYSLRRADEIVVLDRFMKERISNRVSANSRISVIPPWSHSDVVQYSDSGREAFRNKHGLAGKFVVMYSGNHSPCHPLDTLLGAALKLNNRTEVAFCFIGGGSEQAKVREFARLHKLENILCLPYQPLNELSDSLSAGDLHVVAVGNPYVGIVHPSKVYNILNIGGRILYIGPDESHITDLAPYLLEDQLISVRHGGTGEVVKRIVESLERHGLWSSGQETSGKSSQHSKEALVPQLCTVVEAPTNPEFMFDPSVASEPALRTSNEHQS
ncbi:MAG TPA: glycosyltransferase family 4 protein [Pyrinomonadaceae bacterium]